MDSKTFFEEQKNLGLTKERAMQEAELYQKRYGLFDDIKPQSFEPKKILKSKPISDVAGLYQDMISSGEAYDIEARAKAITFARMKYQQDDFFNEHMIAKETGASSLGAIDYNKYLSIQEELYGDLSDETFLSNADRFNANAENDEPDSLRERRKEDVNFFQDAEETIWQGLGEKAQAILDIKNPYAESFYNRVINKEVGKQNIFGGIARGSANLVDQYEYGSWLNWYHHNISLAASDSNPKSRFNRLNDLFAKKARLEKAMGTSFDIENKNWFMKGLTGVASGIAPLAVETGVPALAASSVGGGAIGAGYSAFYMQQMGAGLILEQYLKNEDISKISQEEFERINEVAQTAGVAYAAIERLVGSVPFLKLGSNVDKVIARKLVDKFLKDGIANKFGRTLVGYGVRTAIESVEEGLQAQIEVGTQGILEEIDPDKRKHAIQELKNFDKYFSEEAIKSGFGASVESLPSIAIFGLIGMPMDYMSFRREERTIEERVRFYRINGKYSVEQAQKLSEESVLDNKKGKEARILLATEGYVLQGVRNRKKARDFAERQEAAKNTNQAKEVDIDVTEELLNEIADSLSIDTLIQWGEARGLAEKLVNATTTEEQRAVQEEIFQGLRTLNLQQRQQEFVEMGFSYKKAYEMASQISNNFDQQRKKLQEKIDQAETATEEIVLFGKANMASFVDTMKIYNEATTATAERINEFRKEKASPFSETTIYSRADFAEIRAKYTDQQLKEMFRGFSPDVYEMFVDAINESGTSEREAQMKYNKYIMTQRDKDYKRWLNFNNLRDNRFESTIKIDEETRQQIMAGELDGLAQRMMVEFNLPTIEEGRKKVIEQGEIEVTNQGTQRRYTRKPTRAEMEEIEKQAVNAVKSLQEVSADTEVVFHKSQDDFIEEVGALNRAAYKGNKVHINLELMTQELLENENFTAHEVGHRIFAMHVVNNPVLQTQLLDVYEEIKPQLPADVVADLEKHIEKYKGEDYIPEEYIAQLIGVMAKSNNMLDKPSTKLSKLADTVRGLVGKLPMREETTADMLMNIARSINNGDIITQEDLAFLRTDLSIYTEEEIKTYAEQLKLSTEGTRQQIIERINENIQYTGRNNAENVSEVSRLTQRRSKLEKARVELSKRTSEFYGYDTPYKIDNVSEKLRLIHLELRKIEDRIQELMQMRASKIVSESSAFKQRFKGSVVTTGLNEPKVMFHASNVLFDEFDPAMGDGGMHFGNVFQANKRMEDLYGFGNFDRIYMGYIDVKNPLRMDDNGAWTESPEILSKQLSRMGITLEETEKMKLAERKLDDYYNSDQAGVNDALETELMQNVKYETTKAFIKTIQGLGYDGIVYANQYESDLKGDPDDSYIIFDKDQYIPSYGVPTYGNTSTRASKIDVGYTLSDKIADTNTIQIYEDLENLSYRELQQLGRALKEYDKQRLKNHKDTYFVNTPEYNELYPDPVSPTSLNLSKEDLLESVELAFRQLRDEEIPNLFQNEDFYEDIKGFFPPSQYDVRASKVDRAEIDQFEKPDKFLIPIFKDQILSLLKGEITPEEYVDIVKTRRGNIEYKELPLLPTDNAIRQALRGTKKDFVGKENVKPDPASGKPRDYNKGDIVESRLDIPAYTDNGVYVVAVHPPRPKGAERTPTPMNFVATLRLKNVTFEAPVSIAVLIGLKETPKNTVATMKGEYVSGGTDVSDVENYESAEKYLNDKQWTQIGYNPYLASYFWTRKDFNPVVSADEVVQIGGLIFAKNAKTTTVSDPRFAVVPTDVRPKSYEQIVQFLEGKEPSSDVRFSKVNFGEKLPVNELPTSILKGSDQDISLDARPTIDRVLAQVDTTKKDGSPKKEYLSKLVDKIIQIHPFMSDNLKNASNEEVVEFFVNYLYENILFLHDSMDEVDRERTKLWYDGANRLANQWGERYNLPHTSVAGVMAVLSPQKNWFHNISQAERILDIWISRDSLEFTDEMDAKAPDIFVTEKNISIYNKIKGKKFSELTDLIHKAAWTRLYDETYNDRFVSVVSPEGLILDEIQEDGTKTRYKTRAGWGSFKEIAKAFQILDNIGDMQSLSSAIGQAHKVRNFYNNIANPNSNQEFATIDTHAIAGSTFMPLGGAEPRTTLGLGGSPQAAKVGLLGAYPLYLEAYIRAANARGILPREMQSITWEQIRTLFTDSKKTKSNLKFAEDTLKLFANGEITQDEARQRIIRKIGNFTRPESIRSVSGVDAGMGYRTYDGKLFGAKLPEQKLDVGTITFGRDTGTTRVQDDTKFSKVGQAVDPEFRREIKSQIIALQKLREGEVVETEDGTDFIQGHTPYDTSKKAVERARQLMLGEDPTEPERSTTEEAINRAIERYDFTGRRMLIANLVHSPRPLKDIEVHAIAIHKTHLEEKLDRIQQEVNQQANLNNQMLLDGLQERYTATLREYDTTLAVISSTSSSWGRTGAAIRATKRKEMYSSTNLISQAEIAKGDKLTQEERSEIAKLALEIDQADKNVKRLELEVLRTSEKARENEANSFFQTIARRKKRELDKIFDERRAILVEIGDLGYNIPEQFSGRASKEDINSARLANQIFKLSANFIEGGAKSLDEVVNAVQGILPHVERNAIISIMAERSETNTKRKKSVANSVLNDLSRAKQILDKIENIKEGIFEPKRKVTPDSPEIKRLKEELKTLQRITVNTEADDAKADQIFDLIEQIIDGVVIVSTENLPPQVKSEKLKLAEQQLREVRRLKRVEAKIADMNRILATGDYESLAVPAPKKEIMNQDLKNANIELAKLKAEISNRIYALRDKTAFDKFSEVMGLPRAILASTDMSYALRQGLIVSAGHPILAGKAFAGALKSAFSENNYRLIDSGIKNNPNHTLRVHHGLYFSSIDASLDAREEMFATNLLDKIADFAPIKYSGAGFIIKGLKGFSERNMVTGLNLLRAGLFDKFMQDNPSATDAELEAYARYINVATGRGDLGALSGGAQALAQVFFSPRFTASRIQAPLMALNNLKRSPALRKEMMRQWLSLFGLAVTVMQLARLAGGEVEDDPESGLFGKIKFGNVSLDMFGGLLQPFRVLAITLKSGHVNWIEGDDRYIDVQGVATKFVKYKLSPPFSIGYELLTGKDWVRGSVEAEPLETIQSSLTPLFMQTVLDIHNEDMSGLEASILASEFFGTGTMYFD